MDKQTLTNRVLHANDAQLVALLFEGLSVFLEESIQCLGNEDGERFEQEIFKSREILAELLSTVQGDSNIAMDLRSLYVYVNKMITEAVIQKNPEKLNLAIRIIKPLQEAWEELGTREPQNIPSADQGPAVVSGMTYGKGNLKDYVVNEGIQWDKG